MIYVVQLKGAPSDLYDVVQLKGAPSDLFM